MAIINATSTNRFTLYGMIKYVMDDKKLVFVEGFGVNPNYAHEEMLLVKEFWQKTDRRQFKQIIVSFDPEESESISDAVFYNVGCEICQYYTDSYQVLLAAHADTAHKHYHIVINSVNPYTGIKFGMSRKDLRDFKLYVSEIMLRYGLEPVRMWRVE